MKNGKLWIGVLGLVLAASACQPLPQAAAGTEAPSPTLPAESTFDGTWAGTTTQGQPIRLVVEEGRITSVEVAATVRGEGWTARGELARTLSGPIGDGGGFCVRQADSLWEIALVGVFQDARVEGVVVLVHFHPQGLGIGMEAIGFTAIPEPQGEEV